MSSFKREERKRSNGILIAVIVVLLLIVAAAVFFIAKVQRTSIEPTPMPTAEPTLEPVPTPEPTLSPEQLQAIEDEKRAQEEQKKREAEERRLLEAQYSFYQKLGNGMGVNILVLGDSTAMENDGDAVNGKRFSGLADKLREKYYAQGDGEVTVTNFANGNGNLLADALRVNSIVDEGKYDLVIMCYGLNDENRDVMTNYEALILSLRKKLPDASMICTLEPCFHRITEPLKTMKSVSDVYKIPVVDLFGAFYNSGKESYFTYFDDDQTHLSDVGQAEWDNLLMNVINEKAAVSEGKMEDVKPITAMAVSLSKLEFIQTDDTRIERIDDTTYSLDIMAKGYSYIQHKEDLTKDDARIVADDILYAFGKPRGVRTESGSYAIYVHDDLICKKDFTLSFTDKELADAFEGFYYQPVENTSK